MTELLIPIVQDKKTKLPYCIEMLYVITVYLPNGERAETYSFSSYEGARNNYIDLDQLGNLVELTCNVEVHENEEYSETEYVSIAKNFKESKL